MSSDEVKAGLLVVSFAAWATVHVTLSAKLFFRPPRLHGLVAFVVVPLAPYWGARSGRRVLASAWVCVLLLWLVLRLCFSK